MFGFLNPDDYGLARNVFERCNYRYDAISQTLGEDAWLTPRAIDLPRFERRVRNPTPHNTLLRLFLLGETVSLEQVQQALRPMALQPWIEAEILQPPTSEGRIRSAVRFTPVNDLLIAADSPQLDATRVPVDFVMPPGGTSLQLGWSAVRRPARRMLDLGTGCGYLGLVAGAFSNRVVATDHNQRAVALARFNAVFNGAERMEARFGDLWEPVRGERFDLVLSNPPFVIAPQRRFLFRDSGVRGDEFCRRLIRDAPSYLEEGGFCQMLGNIAHYRGRSWHEDLSGWFADLGCDAVAFVTGRQPIDEYAMTWITTTESQDATVVPRLFNEWMEYYERQQIEQVSYLLINIRRRSGTAGRIFVDEEEVRIAGECGDSIQARFALLDYLAELPSDAALLDECLALDPNVRIVQEHLIGDEGITVVENRLEMRGGLRYSAQLDANVMRFLVRCDGQQPSRAILKGLADSLGLEADRVGRIALPVIRRLIERGFLVPARLRSSPSRD